MKDKINSFITEDGEEIDRLCPDNLIEANNDKDKDKSSHRWVLMSGVLNWNREIEVSILKDDNHQEGEFIQILLSKPGSSIVAPMSLDTAEHFFYKCLLIVQKLKKKLGLKLNYPYRRDLSEL